MAGCAIPAPALRHHGLALGRHAPEDGVLTYARERLLRSVIAWHGNAFPGGYHKAHPPWYRHGLTSASTSCMQV